MKERKKQHHFVLVHGACHGAWCWYKVVTRLRSEGHRVTALDMAAAGADPRCVEEVTSLSAYCLPLMEFMVALPPDQRVVLVGHSMGGVCISIAMDKFPEKIAAAVFVTALMPGPDSPLSILAQEYMRQLGSYMDTRFSFTNGDDKPPTSLLFGPDFMASRLYQLSPPEDLSLATLLVRPLGLYSEPAEEVWKDNHGSVRRFYVVCEQDNVLKQGFQEWMIAKCPVDEVKLIPGADHMVMFSKSHELCSSLQDFADKFC
ncbi:hypothetical protein ACS0TY_029798 [Phlomoides rotata]